MRKRKRYTTIPRALFYPYKDALEFWQRVTLVADIGFTENAKGKKGWEPSDETKVPWGLSVADTAQLSSSDDSSINSRQAEMALERRGSAMPLLNLNCRVEATSCKTSTTVLTEPANSAGGTLRHSIPATPATAPNGVHRHRNTNDNKVNNVVVGIGDICLVEEERAIGMEE